MGTWVSFGDVGELSQPKNLLGANDSPLSLKRGVQQTSPVRAQPPRQHLAENLKALADSSSNAKRDFRLSSHGLLVELRHELFG